MNTDRIKGLLSMASVIVMLLAIVAMFIWTTNYWSNLVVGVSALVLFFVGDRKKGFSYLLLFASFLNFGAAYFTYYIHNESNEGFMSETTAKEYIIDNSNDIYNDSTWTDEYAEHYRVDSCTLNYWSTITIADYCDSMCVIYWGDRDNWQWDIRRDKGFWLYLHSQDTLDNKIFDIIDNIRDDGKSLESADTLVDTLDEDGDDVSPSLTTTIEDTTH